MPEVRSMMLIVNGTQRDSTFTLDYGTFTGETMNSSLNVYNDGNVPSKIVVECSGLPGVWNWTHNFEVVAIQSWLNGTLYGVVSNSTLPGDYDGVVTVTAQPP
jgi:hypothetical protein